MSAMTAEPACANSSASSPMLATVSWLLPAPDGLTGTISCVDHQSNTFWIRPNASHRCSASHVFGRLEHVRSNNVSPFNLMGRKVVSFRLNEGAVNGSFQAFDVVLEQNIDPDDDKDEELFFQANCYADHEKYSEAEAHGAETHEAEAEAVEHEEVEEEVEYSEVEEAEEQAKNQEDEDLQEAEFEHQLQVEQPQQDPVESFRSGRLQVRPVRDESHITPTHFRPQQTVPTRRFGSHQKIKCPYCEKFLNSQTQLEQHLAGKDHAGAASVATSTNSHLLQSKGLWATRSFASPLGLHKTFKCPRCEKFLNSQMQLEEHLAGKDHSADYAAAVSTNIRWQPRRSQEDNLNAEVQVRPVVHAVASMNQPTDEFDLLQSQDPWAVAHTSTGRALQLPSSGLDHPELQNSMDSPRPSMSAAISDDADQTSGSSTWETYQVSAKDAPFQDASGQNVEGQHVDQAPQSTADAEHGAMSTVAGDSIPVFASRAATGYNFQHGNVIPALNILAMRNLSLPPPAELRHLQLRGRSVPDASSKKVDDCHGSNTPMTREDCQVLVEEERSRKVNGKVDMADAVIDANQTNSNDPWAAFVLSSTTSTSTAAAGHHFQQNHAVPASAASSPQAPAVPSTETQYFWLDSSSDELWDPYNSSRVVESARLSAHPEKLSDDEPENRFYSVLRAGDFCRLAHVSDNALDEIKARSEHNRSAYSWTRTNLLKYLANRWIRLLEQGRVLHLVAYKDHALNIKSQAYLDLAERGYSQNVILFHTGLADAKAEAIFVVLVQDLQNGKYVLLASGVHRMVDGKLPEWWSSLLKSPGMHVNGPAYGNRHSISSLMNASYHQGRDQRLQFDPSLEVKLNSHRIVEQNLDRLILGGVDVEEGWYRDRAETDLPDESNWRFLCYKGKKIRELNYDHSYNSFFFSRGHLGKKGVETLVKQWQQDSVKAAAYDSLAVPQFYYKLVPLPNDERKQVYVGRLQLLLPLFCDNITPKLALSIQYQDGATPYYFSATVLTISMANNNARQIATPQLPWIQLIDKERGLDADEF